MKTPEAAGVRQSGTGVWIDGRTAVISVVDADGETVGDVRRVTTELDKQLRLSSGERARTSYGPQTAPPDDMRQTSSRENRRAFFDAVAAAVRLAPRLFVFGPGEAKNEFLKTLERRGLGPRVEGVETEGFLTDRQVAAKTRDRFGPGRPVKPHAGGEQGGGVMRMERSRGEPHADGRPTAEQRSVMQSRLAAEFYPGPTAGAVAVDFPRGGERVASREYSLRISTEATGLVEASIDGGPWRPCRESSGFWWYDWSGYAAGPHCAFARVTLHRRRRLISARRDFVVE